MHKGGTPINKQLAYKDLLMVDVEEEEGLYGFLPIEPAMLELHEQYEQALRSLYPECSDPTYKGVASDEEVADFLKVDVKAIRQMRSEYDMCRIRSLSETVTDDNGNDVALIETIIDPATDNQAAEYLDGLMDGLSDKERYIVCAKNGVLGVEEQTDSAIAKSLCISEEEMTTSYAAALEKLKKAK